MSHKKLRTLTFVCRIERFLRDRVDVAVRCSVAGDFELRIESERSIDTTMPLAALYVEGGSNDLEADLETWTPCRCGTATEYSVLHIHRPLHRLLSKALSTACVYCCSALPLRQLALYHVTLPDQ